MPGFYFTLKFNNKFLSNVHCKTALNIFFIFLTAAAFTACQEDIVLIDHTGFESARYQWESDTIAGQFFYDGVFIDTNKMFFLTISALYEYNGTNYIRHYMPYPFGGYSISGIDENNIYIGGYDVTGYTQSIAALKKWNGAGFEHFTLADTSDKSPYFHSVYSRAYNEHWLSSTKGKVYKFDGSNFTGFSFDTSYWYIDPFMEDEFGNVYFSSKIYEGSPMVTNTKVGLHKYNGTNWQTVYSEDIAGGYGGTFFTGNISRQIYCTLDDELRFFNGTAFTIFAKGEHFFFIDAGFAGSSPSNIFISGFSLIDHNDYLYNYNGVRWSKEFIENEDFQNFTVFYASEKLAYALSYDYTKDRSIVLKGVRK